jgi:hypothetical protein
MSKGQKIMERNVLAEGDKMNLVVAAHARAIHADNERGVVLAPRLIFGGEIRADIADYQRRLFLPRDGYQSLLKAGVVLGKRRGRLGPDH